MQLSPQATWPALPLDSWQDTCATLHMWTQIVGKVRLALAPRVNHWWQVPFYSSARGLTTSLIPYKDLSFEIEFNFQTHQLTITTSDGRFEAIDLYPRSVADFYETFMATLRVLEIDVTIWPVPVEVPNPIPFAEDTVHAAYDADAVTRFWEIVRQSALVFDQFRSSFLGKCSPVHFFWGSFDLAYTRFSGRRAPARNDADPILRRIMAEAYSHEVISFGWWPGAGPLNAPAYYAYAIPEPSGYPDAVIQPNPAFYSREMGEFILLYDDMRLADSPEGALLQFLETSYSAAADLAGWNRAELERSSTGT